MQRSIRITLGLLAVLMGSQAAAQNYPVRPIRVIVPFPAGGNVDVFSRVLFRQVEIEIGGTSSLTIAAAPTVLSVPTP